MSETGGGAEIGVFMSLWIWVWVRASFEIRTSSMTALARSELPPNWPMYSGARFPSGVTDWKAVALRAPLTYSCSCDPVQTQAR